MSGTIWVLAEHWRGQLSPVTYELLALGREVADALGVPLEAVLLGHGASGLAATLGCADAVVYGDHPALAEPMAEPYAEALAALALDNRPAAVLIPLTNVSMGIGPLLAARLGCPGVNFAKDLTVRDGRIEAQCLLYGGKIQACVASTGDTVIEGVWPGARQADQGRSDRLPPVREVQLSLAEPRVRLKQYVDPEPGDVNLAEQDVLVAVGRGIQSQDNLELAENLATALGGAVCGSRPVIDQGWLPLVRQVGKSGVTVKPKLYIAAGISGAPEHIEGMRDADVIVAINSDPDAPIFEVADYGIVGDALDMLPALAEAVEARKG